MPKVTVNVSIRKHPKDPNTFELAIISPLMRTQFLFPRPMLNKLRILIEKALMTK
jgi:hypothetical protein